MEKIGKNETNGTKRPEERRPAFGLFHSRGRGRRPATGLSNGFVAVSLAAQNGGEPPYPTFGWADAIEMRLDLVEVAEVLMVLRGYTESLRDGKGIFRRSETGCTVVQVAFRGETVPGYFVEITKKSVVGGQAARKVGIRKVGIRLTMGEAFALSLALEGSMGRIAFG